MKNVQYNDIYGTIEKQKLVVTMMAKLLAIRERVLEKETPTSGATLDAAPHRSNRGH